MLKELGTTRECRRWQDLGGRRCSDQRVGEALPLPVGPLRAGFPRCLAGASYDLDMLPHLLYTVGMPEEKCRGACRTTGARPIRLPQASLVLPWQGGEDQEKRYAFRPSELEKPTRRLRILFRDPRLRSWCSQIRSILNRLLRRSRLISCAFTMFDLILFHQYRALFLGNGRLHFGQPCQKHPSMKITRNRFGKTKSGEPGNERSCIFQPLMPQRTRAKRNLSSVERFPFERTRLMRTLRSSLVMISTGHLFPGAVK